MASNILFIFTDQQRHDSIAALGNPIIRTPALDRLCNEGTAFTRAYSPCPVCVPARYAMHSGLPPHSTGIVDNMAAPAEHTSFMERLQAQGYQCHGAGKMHFTPDAQRSWGFDSRDFSEEGGGADDYRRFLDERGYQHVHDPHGLRGEMYYVPQPSQLPADLHHSHWLTDRSIDFLHNRDRDRPFFLMTSFIKPHPPFETPTPWNKLYRTPEIPPPFIPEHSDELLCFWNKVQNRYKYHDHGRNELLDRTRIAAYYACISFIDYQIGRLFAALGDEIDDTLILFSADHGELLGDYGSVGKRCMLDAACRVPLLARWPGRLPAGVRCTAPCSLLDIYPTVLHAAGAADEQVHDEGTSLMRIADGSESRDRIYSQFQDGRFGLHMAVDRRYKYVHSAADGRDWFFDHEIDPRESWDLSGNPQYREAESALRERLIQRYQDAGYDSAVDEDGWRRYPPAELPAGRDLGLLFQDAPGLQERIDALGADYARPVGNGGDPFQELLPDS